MSQCKHGVISTHVFSTSSEVRSLGWSAWLHSLGSSYYHAFFCLFQLPSTSLSCLWPFFPTGSQQQPSIFSPFFSMYHCSHLLSQWPCWFFLWGHLGLYCAHPGSPKSSFSFKIPNLITSLIRCKVSFVVRGNYHSVLGVRNWHLQRSIIQHFPSIYLWHHDPFVPCFQPRCWGGTQGLTNIHGMCV